MLAQKQIEKLKETLNTINRKGKVADINTINSIIICMDTFEPLGIGGSRLVVSHPTKDDYVLKIALDSCGIEGNVDEYNTYTNAPDKIKKFLGKVGEIYCSGVALEMKYYVPLESEDEFQNYKEEYNNLMKKIRFIHYKDDMYYHAFGIDEETEKFICIDYGETEKIEIL